MHQTRGTSGKKKSWIPLAREIIYAAGFLYGLTCGYSFGEVFHL